MIVDVGEDGSYVTRNIEDVEAGDWVLTRDQNDPDGALVRAQVTAVFRHQVTSLRTLSVEAADGNVESIVTTDVHPFWVDGVGWLKAKELEAGMTVRTPDGGLAVVIGNTEELLSEPVTVYNLEVAGGHTYFVEDGQGEQTPIWVHNSGDCGVTMPTRRASGGRTRKAWLSTHKERRRVVCI